LQDGRRAVIAMVHDAMQGWTSRDEQSSAGSKSEEKIIDQSWHRKKNQAFREINGDPS
jgi:hypothetical protein